VAKYLRRYTGATKVQDGIVMPAVFGDNEPQDMSVHLCPPDWGPTEISAYIDAFPLTSGSRLGVIEVRDEDFDEARIPRPIPVDRGGPFAELHYEVPELTDEQRAILAKVVSRSLPGALRSPFVRKPKPPLG